MVIQVKPTTTILVAAIVVAAMFAMPATADPNEKNFDTSLDPYTPGDLKNPLGADLHELSPNYCNDYNLSSWYDNNKDSALSPGDVIDITHDDTGVKTYWHVDTVTVTIIATGKGTKANVDAQSNERYFDYVGEDPKNISIEAVLQDYSGLWCEIYPGSGNYSLTGLKDKDRAGLTPGDNITIQPWDDTSKSSTELTVLEVKIDIDVRKMCLGECYTKDNCKGDMIGIMPCWQCLGLADKKPLGESWTSIYCSDFCPCPCDESLCWDECPDCCDGIDNDIPKDGRVDSDGGPYGWDFYDPQCMCCLDLNESAPDACGEGDAWPCVPEVATFALVGIGILGIIGIGLRRRK